MDGVLDGRTADVCRVGLGILSQGRRNERKTDQIHVLVNSNLTAVKVALVEADNRIEALQDLVNRLTDAAKLRKPVP